MGLFQKIKNNISRGGVKIKLDAPASANMKDAELTTTITITAENDVAKVKSVRLELFSDSFNRPLSQPGPANMETSTQQVVARSDFTQSFMLQPGESRTLQLKIALNAAADVEKHLPEGSAVAAIAHGLAELQDLSQTLNQNSYRYYLTATADVEGVALDPSTRQDIQLLKPNQLGGAINIKL